MWAYRPYRPPPDALLAYDRGVDALHSMAYETARKALEQTIAIDPAFALAHASLARAYDELDYTDRAKDAMLRAIAAAQESRLTADAERRLRALQFMVQRDYERAAPLVRQVEAEATGTDRAAAALESGWLAQQMEHSEAAAAAFERALTLEPWYAAAKLRLGFLFGRQGGKDDMALSAFREAEQLYRAAGNTEGVTQTLLEQANLLDRRNREKEALPIIEQALTVARGVGNRYQEIRLRFLQATAIRDLGDTTRAADLCEKRSTWRSPRTWTIWPLPDRSTSATSTFVAVICVPPNRSFVARSTRRAEAACAGSRHVRWSRWARCASRIMAGGSQAAHRGQSRVL